MNLGALMQDGIAVDWHQCIMICDSFMMLRGDAAWHDVACDVMLQVLRRTHIRCMLVVVPGASFKNRMYDEVFHCMQQCVAAPGAIVWIAMGNDIFPPGDKRIQRNFSSIEGEIKDFFFGRRWFCLPQCLVFGGSSALWGYDKTMEKMHCEVYDSMVSSIVQTVKKMDIPCMTGHAVFSGLQVVDSVGHVSQGSQEVITQGLCILAKWGIRSWLLTSRFSKL